MERDVAAALIWKTDEQGAERFMICQRPRHKSNGLLWEFVGGKAEPGETLEQTLIRECREELDITVAPGDIFMEVIHESPDLTVRLTLFHAVIARGTPKALEHNDIRWITTREIDGLAFCPADEEILEKFATDEKLRKDICMKKAISFLEANAEITVE